MTGHPQRASPVAGPAALAGRDIAGLLFLAEMYGVQLDHLAAVLGVGEPQARAAALRWRRAGHAAAARLGPGKTWFWLTRDGLAACGLPYAAGVPALSRLAHLRAVVSARLALESAAGFREAGAFWRSERRLRARMGGRVGLTEHVPDGEVHWPEGARVSWAGECWAIEVELTRKTLARTATIMREVLARTADYGAPAAEIRQPGAAPRHARVLYLCSPAARPVVARARAGLGALGTRVEVRGLPADARLDTTPGPEAGR